MLQPRNSVLLFVIFFALQANSQFIESDSDVRPTPTLRLSDQDVTTVLLVDTKDRAAHGKFFNIKPEVGLLKSTARTFIQEGVTTEYATQVVGTTLENGLYAQLLATTSRVLYDHDNGATKIPALQYHQYNEITPVDQKDQWNGQFIKNTDYISPNNPFVVFPSRHNYDPVANRQAKELERNVVTIGQHELLPESQAQVAPRRESSSESLVSSESNSAKVEEVISPKKVISDSNLPTFTVSNVFAPSAFTADDEVVTERNSPTTKSDRIAKVLFRGGVPEQDLKHLSTVTYYGFADFTTIVGDTMIVFSPSTAAPASGGQATSIQGEATLQESVATTTKTFVSHERQMVTETVPKNDVVMQTKIPTFVVEPVTPSRDSKEMEDDEEDYDTTTNPYTTSESTESSEEELVKKLNVLSREQDVSKYDTTTSSIDDEEITTNENTTPKLFNVTPEQIEPSEVAPVADKPSLSKPSNEDILKALASLQAKVEKSSEAPEKVIQTGVTTIFFDDDPFAIQPTEVVTTAKASEKAETTTEKQETTDKVETTTETKPVTEGLTEKPQTTTESDEKTTTEKGTTFPTTLDVTTEKSAEELLREAEVQKALRKIKAKEDLGCKDDVEIIPSTVFKTLTYLTTYFIPDESNPDTTSTSIKSNAKVSTSVHYASQCIEATNVVTEAAASVADETTTLKSTITEDDSTESTSTTSDEVTEAISTTESSEDEERDTTLPNDVKGTTEIVTTKMHVTEEPLKITTEKPEKKDDEDEETEDYDSEEEIDVIYKTLYTTYTYLTTFFVDQTTSVSSRKEVVTNVITQTLDPNENSDLIALINDMAVDKTASAIQPTKTGKNLIDPNTATDVGIGRPTTTFNIPESDLIGINQLLVEQGLLSATPALDEKYYLETAGPKTLFTTYTYFTTVFVDGETEISSRTEVFTNILNNDVTPTAKPSEIVDATEYVQKKDNDVLDSSSDEQPNVKEKKPEEDKKTKVEERVDDDNKIDNEIVQPKYSTMVRNPTSSEQSDDVVTMVTDVKSSSSLGDKRFIDRIDQESSESNYEEVLPSPQLLLQTSYTTFTYFTTLFNPSASTSKIESRLETITNIVTETLNPTQTLQLNDDSAPITYYTTFTYWTTLFKDGSTTTTSREETISNVVNPTAVVKFDSSSTDKIDATSIVVPVNELQTVQASEASNSEDGDKKVSSTAASIEPTTYYTTYTYFTTSYVGDETVLNSRFETITNIVTPTPVLEVRPTSRAIDLNKNSNNNLIDSNEKGEKNIAPAYVFPSNGDADATESAAKVVPFSPVQDPLKPTGVLFLNEGKIVDADGISSILYTTKTIGTVIDDTYTQVVESSSKVQVDELKKALKTSETDVTPGNRKTGLVRLYDGTIVANHTTTFYQSKVIGTYIDEKYAQIIESTSSFVIEKTVEPSNVNGLSIEPTATVGLNAAKSSISPTPAVLAGSISDSHDDSENEDHDEEDDDDEEGSGKSRLSYTPKKPSFTPVIRPFASRPRPTFNPAKKNRGGATSAQTITRSDITPTITATPTVKAESSSRNRFGGRRSSSALNNVIQSSSAASVASGANSSSRRFSRPGRISATPSVGGSGLASSSRVRPTSSVNRIQPTVNNLASSRRGGLRSSSVQPRINLSSAGFAGNSRFNRIRPTASLQGTSPSTAGITTTPNDFTESPDVITHEVTQTATEDSVEEEVATTTENSRRRGNPLLNFRRPPLSRAPGTAAGNGPTSRPAAAISTRRNPLTRTSQRTTTTTTTTTARPKARAFSRPSPLPIAPIGNRPRPAGNNLFPPRSLLRTTPTPKPVEQEEQENENEEADDTENDFHDDTDQEGSNIEEQVVEQAKPEPPKAVSNTPNIRPFSGLRRRSKRQVDYGTRYQSRYQAQRKPKVQTVDYYYDDETEAPPKATSRTTQSRFRSRSTQQPQTNNRIRPTSASSSQSRSQFTLRDNSNSNSRTSNFRRPQTIQSSSNRRASTRSSSRYNQYSNTNNRNTQRPRTTISGRRTSSRTRAPKVDPYIPQNDGTITVTHHIPTETKIPIVNNGHTEYKNIITEKTSVEVLGPKQYYTSTDPMGKVVTLLSSDMTAVNGNGLTEVTQFVLFESPTSSVIFTPTTIRGRRTSFSHIIPSTVYDVHPTVSTQNVGLAANAPLANILLSQLLLGNVGLPLQQQQTINPLLSFQQQPQPQIANTPMTEYKVRTTMYETTLTSATSTVLPLTFHGKQILTTIVETSTNVITATEFITDTIVVTPTATAQNQQQQLNSLLLPLLLQQAPQIQQPLASQESGVLNQIPDTQENLEQDEKQFDNIQSIRDDNSRSKEVDEYDTYDDLAVKKPVEKPKVNPLKNFKKYENKKQEQFKPAVVAAPKTSVVTLYVSGRRPGEFSTVLSTYVVGEDSAVSKRSANYVEVVPSRLSTLNKKTEIDDLVDIYQAEASNNIDEFYLAGTNEISLDPSHELQRLYDSETASLESVLGDFSQYYVPESPKITSSSQQHVAKNQGKSFNHALVAQIETDEARFNLATRVMSNGVEVIVASDKSTLPGDPNILRILPSSIYKPYTLAASTLKNNVLMMLPSEPELDEISASLIPNQFVTKTCLTTFTYLTTYMQDGKTKVESREKVISNIATEERNTAFNIIPTPTAGILLSQTPNLAVGEFHTTYTYLNTILDGDLPIVVTSRHTVTNTITAPDDYLSLLQPSEQATPVYDTNTYFSTVSLTKTLNEDAKTKILKSTDVLTQVVITEFLPPGRMTLPFISGGYDLQGTELIQTTDVVKTYFVTYTYYNTIMEDGKTILRSNVSTSSDVVTEKLYLYPKKTMTPLNVVDSLLEKKTKVVTNLPFQIFSTKTYMTTFTYFTTVLHKNDQQVSSTVVNSHTKVVENVKTETVPNTLLPEELVKKLKKSLRKDVYHTGITTLATLLDKQTIEITAMSNVVKPSKKINSKTSNIEPTSILKQGQPFTAAISSDTIKPSSVKTTSKPDTSSKLSSNAIKSPLVNKKKPIKDDFETAASNAVAQIVAKNSTKINKVKPSGTKPDLLGAVPDLLGSFSMDRFSALSPLINTMAGIIQNNFLGGTKNDSTGSQSLIVKHVHETKPHPEAIQQQQHQTQPQQNEIIPVTDPQNRSPIYIPVNGKKGPIRTELENSETQISEQASYNGFIPPPNEWIDDDEKRNHILAGQSHSAAAGIGGGIPISPGEIINTNADVIVGRPGAIGPRIPYNSRINEVPIGMQPPPLPIEHVSPTPIPLSNVVHHDSHQQGSNVNENYIGPPPPMTKQTLNDIHQKQNQQKLPQNVPHNQQQQNLPPPIQQGNPILSQNNGQRHPPGLKNKEHPRPLIMPGNSPFKRLPTRPHGLRLQQKPVHDFGNELFHPPPPAVIQQQQNHHQQQQIHQQQQQNHQQQQPNNLPLPSNQNEIIQTSEQDPSQMIHHQNLDFINKNHGQVFEIQKAPAVFSTDLPPVRVMNHQEIHHGTFSNDVITHNSHSDSFNLPEILDSHRGQPLLVNIQPSQVASVLIPQGSTSALVFGGAIEPHKKGEYIDDPPPYLNSQVGISAVFGNSEHSQNNIPQEHAQSSNNIHSIGPIFQNHAEKPVFEQQLPAERPPPPFRGDLKIPDYHSNVHITGDNLEISVSPLPIIVPSNDHEAQQVQAQGVQGHVSDAKLPTEYSNIVGPVHPSMFNQQSQSQQQRPAYHPGHVKDIRLHPHRPQRPPITSNVVPFKQMPKHNPQQYSMINAYINKVRPFNNGRPNLPPPSLNPVPNPVDYMTPPQFVPNEHHQQHQQQSHSDGQINAGPPIIPLGHPEAPHFNPYQENELSNIVHIGNEGPPHDNEQKGPENVDSILDHHKEDDSENENGEVVQESNNVVAHALDTIESSSTTAPSSTEQQTSAEIYQMNEYESQKINDQINFVDSRPPSSFNHIQQQQPQGPFFIESNKRPAPVSKRPPLHFISIPKRPSPPPRLEIHYPRRPTKSQNVINKIPPVYSGGNNIRQRPQVFYHPSVEQTSSEEMFITPVTESHKTTHETTTGVTTYNVNIVHEPSTTHSHKYITRKPVTGEKDELSLNTGEIMKDDDHHHHQEIFDSKESQNPHNYGSIEIEYEQLPKQPSLDILPPKKGVKPVHQEGPIYYELDGSISTPQPFLPRPSEDMRPPPPVTHENTVTIFHAPKPTTTVVPKDSGEVLGMSPPPPPIVKVEPVRDHSRFPVPMVPPSKFTKQTTSATTEKSVVTQAPITRSTSNRRPTFSLNMYVTPTSTEKNLPDYPVNQFNRTYTNMNRRPIGTPSRARDPNRRPGVVVNEPSVHDLQEINSKSRYQHSTMQRTRSSTTSEVSNSEIRPSTTVSEANIITSHDIGLNDGEMYVNVGFGGHHASDDDIIYGSETPDFEERPNIITKPSSNKDSRTPELNPTSTNELKLETIFENLFVKPEDSIESESNINKGAVDVPPSRGTPSTTGHKGRENNRLNVRPIAQPPKDSTVPTKFITNTKTLTITTTKTTVVRSQGIPSTQLITKTFVSTVLDTVTETHTLVQPTRITVHATPTTRHVTTTLTATTSIIEHHFPNYPPVPIHNGGIFSKDPQSSFDHGDDEDLDEFIIEPDADRLKPHHTKSSISSSSVMGVGDKGHGESIFVVMSDKKSSGVFKIEPSMIETHYPKKTKLPNDMDNEIATRDEPLPEDVNHVLLGGILIASPPPRLGNFSYGKNGECRPECKATKNEVCQRNEGLMKCVCRPGFARMFPDRPCKPTYTYAMKLALDRSGKETLVFDQSLSDPTSPAYSHLSTITHEGLDRTAMQSELRDIYHGIHVQGFEEIPQQSGIFSNFYLQLSDNINEKRLVDIFKAYLMHHNYSLGGTDLFAARPLNELEAADFDECEDSLFHDCSPNAQCFNLRGTYTCSCLQGFADLSENPLYPGRKCSAEQMGCEKCHYHGTCVSRGDEQQICECFQWYTGASCHINLKVLLIGLVTLGIILLGLLFICCILTCCKGKRRRNAGHLTNNIGIIPHRATSSHHSFGSKIDKRAMINNDTCSETSDDSHVLPYVKRKSKTPTRVPPPKIPKPPAVVNKNKMAIKPNISTMEQRDRSLTVMIPRAKYHPAAPNSAMDIEYDRRSASVCSTTEAKLINYLDASPSTSKSVPPKKKSSPSSSKSRQPSRHSMSTGALVSAGFEVSASGGSSSNKRHFAHKVSTISEHTTINQSTIDDLSIIKKSHSHGDLIDSMDDWLEHVPQNDLRTVSEARSYDETTIQAPTKSLRSCHYDKQSSHMNNDEANTMAEREVGSTLLMPHTHLYKQGSDISGFDSL